VRRSGHRRRGPRHRRRAWPEGRSARRCDRPQTWSCSTAAARKVSPATMPARSPWSRYWRASFAMVVVLPVPFTPTTSTTCGARAVSSTSGFATGARMAAISSASVAFTSSSVTSLPKRVRRKASTMREEAETPRSAAISVSSSSSSAASSSFRLVKTAVTLSVSLAVERAKPAFKRENQPWRAGSSATVGGASIGGSCAGGGSSTGGASPGGSS
jgi:hypothetical protein